MKMPVSYNAKQITAWLGSRTVAKARGYLNAVSALRWQNAYTLSGQVQGTRTRPYKVRIHFHDIQENCWIEGLCSCPVSVDCKHVAALLIAGIDLLPVMTPTDTTPSTILPATGTPVRPELVAWLENFRTQYTSKSNKPKTKVKKVSPSTEVLAYVITPSLYDDVEISLYKAQVRSNGTINIVGDTWQNVEKALIKPPKFISEEDLPLLRRLWSQRSRGYPTTFELTGEGGAMLLEKLIATGRTFASSNVNTFSVGTPCILQLGAERKGQIVWQTQPDARVRPRLQTDPSATILIKTIQPCWYIDLPIGEAGPIHMSSWSEEHRHLLSMPAISLEEASLVGNVLRDVVPEVPLPPAHEASTLRVIDMAPVPCLSFNSLSTYRRPYASSESVPQNVLDFATVSFDYAEINLTTSTTTLIQNSQGEVVQIKRYPDLERRHLMTLRKAKLQKIPSHRAYGPKPFPDDILGFEKVEDWTYFMQHVLPMLREDGWRVTMTPEFRFNVIEIEAIDGTLHQSNEGWFDVEMGITVNNQKIRLEPLLANLFQRDARWLSGKLDGIADDELIDLQTASHERLRLRADRLKPVVRVLIDLFGARESTTLRISAWDIGRLDMLDQTGRWQFHGDTSIQQLAKNLMMSNGVGHVDLPSGLQAELRPYQHQGLNWMQFLREKNLSGILADDMGLGKTLQTLAHILTEKEAGRLDQPVLIVVPTSLIYNWRLEAKRFTPSLRVLDLQGPLRHTRFDQIPAHDMILTTYPLLWRDQRALAAHTYHLLILDEAQYIKNSATKTATMIRELGARHRLCLTGTPLENHLGELWAQFDFLLPGFLGSHKDFTQRWRTPIEKNGDVIRRDLLTRRIRPFILRRRKHDVAAELPPKTTIVQTVELEGAQRDLYETVRAAMQEKVRAAINAKGFARSHIIMLEALLKLRQVCCDPRLVKLKQASRVKESAKLTLLCDILPKLIEEGRRILLFSQFTGMLALIAEALDKAAISYVTLTGDTTDRHRPIQRFQQGEVPLFLISLKAGGVGLNLTAADTVIHYDPWWNPAVENQATDRAHRLGQDKPIFVYKLITADSVEEKIMAMQAQKAALAEAILAEDAKGAAKFSADNLEALFEPMPIIPTASEIYG